MKTKHAIFILSIMLLGLGAYISCKDVEKDTSGSNFLLARNIPGYNPNLPPLMPGDTPGDATLIIQPNNDGTASVTINITGGTPATATKPGLYVTCDFTVYSLSYPTQPVAGFAPSQQLDASGAATFSFPRVLCSWSDPTNINAQIVLNCATSQQPAIQTNYLNNNIQTFTCPF